ncbi:Panacea domain-containing protein [Salimicrobium salexigens]|uniref:Uncharacterized phage-associated protein n=1 Tax=Salimicrobium salexigens TaxID=908941 RepID=A0ABY1KM71_9BACI|nr:type II toxin-antitoxin system antitoxin SocA domain-containing protein [Salimicrobium salexigens]SIS49202.1 Uncharacterized phage-associated protein [Salimicrobium salexigens]
MVYRAMTIANYVVEKASELGRPVSNLQLQKILYYLQLHYLGKKGEPLLAEPIEKWKFGPVIPNVYHEFKRFGSSPISFMIEDELFMEDEFVDDEDEKFIDVVVNNLSNKDGFYLVKKTHQHSPWKSEKEKILKGAQGLSYSQEELLVAYNEDGLINV